MKEKAPGWADLFALQYYQMNELVDTCKN